MRQLRIFRDMVQNGTTVPLFPDLHYLCFLGLIYRRYRPVHFSPSSRSALAEAELVYKDDHVSHSVYVSFELQHAEAPVLRDLAPAAIQLLVWTTTPWTLTANMVSTSVAFRTRN